MYQAKSVIPAVQDLAGEWVKHAAEGTASQTDAVVGWALSRINHADVPSVVHGVVLTLTGNKKTAKKARRTAAVAVMTTTKALRRKTRQRRSMRAPVMVALVAAGLGAAAVLAWRMLMPPGEPAPAKPGDGTTQPGKVSDQPTP